MEFHEHRAFQFFKEASYEELLQKIDHDPNLLSSTIIDRKYGYNFFMWACSHGSLDKATMFVRRGINLEQTDKVSYLSAHSSSDLTIPIINVLGGKHCINVSDFQRTTSNCSMVN